MNIKMYLICYENKIFILEKKSFIWWIRGFIVIIYGNMSWGVKGVGIIYN